MLTAKVHVFSDSVFCTGPESLDPIWASKIGDKNAEIVINSDSCNDVAGQSIDTGWHVCPGDTSDACQRPGTNMRVFGTGTFLRARSKTLVAGKILRRKLDV